MCTFYIYLPQLYVSTIIIIIAIHTILSAASPLQADLLRDSVFLLVVDAIGPDGIMIVMSQSFFLT